MATNDVNNWGDQVAINFLQQQGIYTGSNASAGTPTMDQNLNRSDFKKIEMKGLGNKHYFSIQRYGTDYEYTLEPCQHGFCVSLFHQNERKHSECTNLDSNIFKEEVEEETKPGKLNAKQRLLLLDQHITQERSNEVWDKAGKIANEFQNIVKNEGRLKDWGFMGGASTGDYTSGATNADVNYDDDTLQRLQDALKKSQTELDNVPKWSTTSTGTPNLPGGSCTDDAIAKGITDFKSLSINNDPKDGRS